MISATLAEALQARRDDFNVRFRLTAQRYPQLDGQELFRFIGEAVDPLVVAVHGQQPDAVSAVVDVAYDCGLQMVGQRLSLESGRYSLIPETWRSVLPAAAAVVAQAPDKVIPAVVNAVHQLAGSESANARRWKEQMTRIATEVSSADELLLSGQVLAWLCGLAHYREGALAALGSLSDKLVCSVLQIEPKQRAATLQRLQADRWFDPWHPANASLRVVRSTGSFRGLGGSFLQPPVLKGAAGGWLVQSADDYWFLTADAFGATLHRATVEEWKSRSDKSSSHVGTRLTHEGRTLDLPGAGPITSSGVSEDAIACTFAHTHSIVLVALK